MTTTAELLKRVEAYETELEAHRGYIKAIEYGLRAVIISHPEPRDLRNVWRAILPGIADSHFEETPLFSTALRQGLSLLSEQIEETAATK